MTSNAIKLAKFKGLKKEIISENREDVKRFASGMMSKKDSSLFIKVIKNKIPYTKNVSKVAIANSFKNALQEIEFLEDLANL